jgi:hypothetical protein
MLRRRANSGLRNGAAQVIVASVIATEMIKAEMIKAEMTEVLFNDYAVDSGDLWGSLRS